MAAIFTIQKLNILIKNCYTIEISYDDKADLMVLAVKHFDGRQLEKVEGNTIDECLDKLDWDELI